ncbi:MAG TPA: TIGR00725 family protein [Thermomicrobiales bacterium]|nr:TIGR00725 family protein [Thermomicrobiales bacterium]
MTAPSVRPLRISVCAPGVATDDELAAAEAVGKLIAEAGGTLVCGGLGGAMAAACRGAKGAGGVTIGIVPGYDDKAANPWVDHVVCTGLGQARNVLVAATGQALIAVGGGAGTLSEIGLGVRLGRPVVLLGGWAAALGSEAAASAWAQGGKLPIVAATPEEAVQRAIAAARGTKGEEGRG